MILLHGRILRGFPFGNDIESARWRGGKEALKASTAADRAGIISFPNGNPRKIRPCNKIILK